MHLYKNSLTRNKELFYESQFNILSEAEYFSSFCANKLFHIVNYINTNNNQDNGDMLCSFLKDMINCHEDVMSNKINKNTNKLGRILQKYRIPNNIELINDDTSDRTFNVHSFLYDSIYGQSSNIRGVIQQLQTKTIDKNIDKALSDIISSASIEILHEIYIERFPQIIKNWSSEYLFSKKNN
jgi:hypothetical protein